MPFQRWTPARGSRTQRVHFGEGGAPRFRVEQTGSTFATGALRAGTAYTWRVDTVTADGVKPGPVWTFVTKGATRP